MSFVLQADLDQFKGDDYEGFGRSSCGPGENGEGLVHFGDAESAAVDFAPFVVGRELCGTAVVVSNVIRGSDQTNRLGASIRIGAVIPRYRREKLSNVSKRLVKREGERKFTLHF